MGFDLDISNPLFWLRAIQAVVVFLISLSVHEYAHARVAYALGDDTASRQGRMTLNPVVHIDFIGTIIMPMLGAAGVPVIGWAKPVPVSPVNFSRRFSMRGGHALVSIAGPASNIVLAVACTLLLWAAHSIEAIPQTASVHLNALLSTLVLANVGLALFNLLPIPPLDGSHLMPRSMDRVMEVLERFTFVIFILIILFAGRFLAYPVLFIVDLLGAPFGLDILNLYLSTRM